ncbi:hypothetical protein [Streptomyces sp. NPDC001743]|uniref:hypothetical protein n=1 Tax=Streptomyces sp. NPDC001743 TaxID=3154397 RepID=UPI00332AEF55
MKLDWTGVPLVSTAALLLVHPLVQGREQGWPAWMTGMLVASVPAFGGFAGQQRRTEGKDGSPLIVRSLQGDEFHSRTARMRRTDDPIPTPGAIR